MTHERVAAKLNAATRAVDLVRSGMVVGLGTGSTAGYALEEIAARLRARTLRDIVGIPTSVATGEQAAALGIPISTLERHRHVDMTIDGADEVDPQRRLLKGAGGALLWEKIVASISHRLVIVVDPSKCVERLATRNSLPIEVAAFGWTTHLDAIRDLGAEPKLRKTRAGEPYHTDSGHFVVDARFPDGIADPEAVVQLLRDRPGVIETGLFLHLSPEVVVGQALPSPSSEVK